MGLSPAQQARAVEVTGLDEAFRAGDAAGRLALYRLATTNPPGAQDGAVVSSAAWRAAEIPAVDGPEPRPRWPGSTTPWPPAACLAWRPSRPLATRLRIAEMTPSGAAAPASALRRQIIQIGAPA